jgi:hypothetical protein
MKYYVIAFTALLLFNAAPLPAQQRTVLCEMFTSTTCPPCVGANQAFDTWLGTYAKKNRVAVVKYHVWWPAPGNDPFYFANKTQASTRNSFYGNNYAPHMFIDGSDGGSSYSPWPATIESELAKESPLEISMKGSVKGSDLTVTLTVKSGSAAIPAGTLRLHVAFTESGLVYTGTNGDPNHDHVMRSMVSDAGGEVFTISANETKTFTRTVALDPSWVLSKSRVVAFVQVQETRSIVQASVRTASEVMTNVSSAASHPAAFVVEQNYPNPFNPSTSIRYALPAEGHVLVSVHDLLGRTVAVLADEVQPAGWNEVHWNAGTAASGIYYYSIHAGPFMETKMMLYMR